MGTRLIETVVSVAPEMGFETLTVELLTAAVAARRVVIEPFDHGFFVVQCPVHPKDEPGVDLKMLYVEPEHRGKGIGTAMLKAFVAKHRSEWGIGLECTGKRLSKWFRDRGFHVFKKDGDTYMMTDLPVQKNKARRAADELFEICRRLENCARRLGDDELTQVLWDLGTFALLDSAMVVDKHIQEQRAKAKRPRNSVTTAEIINFRDSYPKSKLGTPKKGWIIHAPEPV